MNIRSLVVVTLLFASVFMSAIPGPEAVVSGCPVAFVRPNEVFSPCCNYASTFINGSLNLIGLWSYNDTVPRNIRSLEVIKIAKEMGEIGFVQSLDKELFNKGLKGRSLIEGSDIKTFNKLFEAAQALRSRFMILAKDIAKERGAYALLEPSSCCVCFDSSCDVTQEVVDTLNREFKANQS